VNVVPDVLGPGLDVLFCGVNPGLMSAAKGQNFARPGNRFWPALHLSGFTPVRVSPADQESLIGYKLGITNLVSRQSARADELSRAELAAGAKILERKLRRYQPRWLAVLGLVAYRQAFGQPRAVIGEQPEPIAGVRVWLLPNPSGLNAHFTLSRLTEEFSRLREAL
jgi:TDG/mug DNA glycosylase family protein